MPISCVGLVLSLEGSRFNMQQLSSGPRSVLTAFTGDSKYLCLPAVCHMVHPCTVLLESVVPVLCLQLPPWQAPPADVDRLQQWQDTGVLPTELASLLTDGGVITLANNGQLSLEQLQRLLPGKWLNDELINYAMWLYQQRDACMQGITHPWFAPQWSAAPGFSCHFFNSFFMAKLYLDACRAGQCKPGQIKYAAVRRWTTLGNLQRAGQARFGTGVLSCRLLIAPCNLGNSHWVLVVADLELRRLLYLDSAGVSV